MTNQFLLMSQNTDLAQQLHLLCKKAQWDFVQITTPTGLVVQLERQSVAGIWWDLSDTTLDTTIATMILIRNQVPGPITVFTPKLTERIQRKLYKAQVDDIITFPFNQGILQPLLEQRLRLYRRLTLKADSPAKKSSPSQSTSIGNWLIDRQNYTVTKNDHPIELTPKEFQLLVYLVDHHNQVLSREQLINGVWGYDILNTSRIVDIHISHLRDKLEDDPHSPNHLQTVRGFGYKLIK
ncbi:MAG: winged helix-turn-helix domain-containing protein [Limosilactobacillus sp.]|jgi:DNA-binding response OmpR family regulator|uniref:winged helix-turn-helix domain-containing protein n=1 Tax=Limosilactobacillus sp. TaxID=2773925 RepID=UPI0025C5A6C4|nr:winged helix-turn-helix domain-containing protein [Limosilactobacillus sp.]MCI1975437.1 winged helix-turn-helix domain-containing protein [Limosilactobacillus sp.]MCI2030368.1 winged helix-turn-helix domain-containing protein [Limosilactobacillus sp.]